MADDFSALRKLRTTPEVMRWTHQGRIDLTEHETKAWMDNFIYENDEMKRSNYNFVVWRRESPENDSLDKANIEGAETEKLSFIGVLGVISLAGLHGPEVGYLFLPEAWGKGYATEALNGFTTAWWELPLHKSIAPSNSQESQERGNLFAVTNKSNTGSAKVLAKCGWSTTGEGKENIQDCEVAILKWILKRPLCDVGVGCQTPSS
jgi:RimJ/RimL family protein N-acetyltransferase